MGVEGSKAVKMVIMMRCPRLGRKLSVRFEVCEEGLAMKNEVNNVDGC